MKVAFYSGGKDSVYAALREWPVDMFIFLLYQFPRPSPHLMNMNFAVRLGSGMAPVLVYQLERGREFQQKAELLRRLGADIIVAGDVDVEEHLKYMERLAGEVGAVLKEPLWGMDHYELLAREVEELEFIVIGSSKRELLCRRVGRENFQEFASAARALGIDVLGEYGEYHSQVVSVSKFGISLNPTCKEVVEFDGYSIALI
ncbi:ATPase [Pyrobaculum aerophilum]|uniref:ATPase n=1 Tax=Pyrobaculum aerophilum TaxID=13773 RepID=A0A371R4W0_9CREN|nr:ATPase [Pyrobaculum aerophilum]RFA95972.1 ATPase [Pyrobaculum aerophilum]RFA99122.1 ATPase [Pyrobaculum aerophilum]